MAISPALTNQEKYDVLKYFGYAVYSNTQSVVNERLSLLDGLSAEGSQEVRQYLRELNDIDKELRALRSQYGKVQVPGAVQDMAQRKAMLQQEGREYIRRIAMLFQELSPSRDYYSGDCRIVRG